MGSIGPTRAMDADARLGPLVALLERIVAAEGVPGAAVAVGQGGRPVATSCAGEAAPGRRAARDTLWPIASISKLYTATAALALVERGVLALSQPVHTVVPACVGAGRERITIRHLLTHTSGLIYESPEMEARLRAHTPLDALVDDVFAHPLRFPPGTKLDYSDLGFALLGRAASLAAGMPFPDLVRDLVLTPAGLHDTCFPPTPEHDDRLAAVPDALAAGSDGAMYGSRYAFDLAHPAFGAVATVDDLLRFGLTFAPGGPRILAAATIRAMTTDQTAPLGHAEPDRPDPADPGAVQPWGLGFELKTGAGYPALAAPGGFGHDGATGCVLWIDPVHDVTVAFVSNRHANADGPRQIPRLERVINTAIACLTR